MEISTEFMQTNLNQLRQNVTNNRAQAQALLDAALRDEGAAQVLEQLISIKNIPADAVVPPITVTTPPPPAANRKGKRAAAAKAKAKKKR